MKMQVFIEYTIEAETFEALEAAKKLVVAGAECEPDLAVAAWLGDYLHHKYGDVKINITDVSAEMA